MSHSAGFPLLRWFSEVSSAVTAYLNMELSKLSQTQFGWLKKHKKKLNLIQSNLKQIAAETESPNFSSSSLPD